MSPHEQFLELAAASTSGELTQEERQKLEEHLAVCAPCRQRAKELETTILTAVPAIAPHLPLEETDSNGVWSENKAESRLFERLAREQEISRAGEGISTPANEVAYRGYSPSRIRWGHLGLTAAAIALFALSLGMTAYRSAKKRNANGASTREASGAVLEEQLADAGHDARGLIAQIAERDKMIANLQQQMQQNSGELKELRAELNGAVVSAQSKSAESISVAEQNKRLAEQAKAAEIRNDDLQREAQVLEQERSELSAHSSALEAKVAGLTEELRGQQETIARQKEYLDHDRDIRELMGARDLYIAEVYDVERNGDTNKPYGRVFYTRGKSLVFYAYDLDQQASLKDANTFQAWGRRGADNQKALSLGVLYEDNVSKKRWVVRSNDPKTLKEIDAVFVTVEPNGGSQHPSSEPLLFAYLRVHPNHP